MIAPAALRSFVVAIFLVIVLLVAGSKDAKAAWDSGTNPATIGKNIVITVPTATASREQEKAGQMSQPDRKIVTRWRDDPNIDPCANIEVSGETWLDQMHDYVARSVCEPAVWFDQFFGDDRVLQDVRPGTFIRLRNSAVWTEGQRIKYLVDFHLDWRLPQWESYLRKASVYYESRSESAKYTAQPGQPLEPGVDPETGVKQSTLGLRADLFNRFRSHVSFDTGVNAGLPPNAFMRLKYQYSRPFGDVYLVRFSQIPMWQIIGHFSDSSELDIERTVTTFSLVRWSYNAAFIGGTPGVTWNTGISFITQLTPRSGISYDTSMWGVNAPAWIVQDYRVGSKYRLNFYRRWLFLELAPEITWPKDENGKRKTVDAFLVTLEIQFGE